MKRLLSLLAALAILAAGCSIGQPSPATDVTDNSATLNASISSNQEGEVTYWFEYGTDTNYGTVTPDRTIDFPEGHTSNDDAMDVSEAISGLAPGTTYHYRVCTSPGAEAGSRGCTNQDESFTTTGTATTRYIAMGDSMTQVGDPQRYPDRFFSYLDQAGAADQLNNIGENGQTSGGINGNQLTSARQLIDDATTNTTVVTIDIGGNDILTNSSCLPSSSSFNLTACQPVLEQFSTNFNSTLEALNDSLDDDPGSEQLIVIAYYNPWSGRSEPAGDHGALALRGSDRTMDCDGTGEQLGLNDRIACIGADHGAKLADLYPPFVGHGAIGDYFADDVHPNGTGHQVIADLLQDVFEATGP
jgi:lysophospholipase L1-like esterase